MDLAHLDLHDSNSKCAGQRYWYVFFISSLLTFFGGLCAIICWRIIFGTILYVHDIINPKIKRWVIFFDLKKKIIIIFNGCFQFKYNRKYEEKPYTNKRASCDIRVSFTYGRDFCGELISGKNFSNHLSKFQN